MQTRRQILQLGSLGLLGSLLSGTSARGEARAPAIAKSTIVLFMNGGPSHVDTFDPKPGSKGAGPFKAIATRAAGVQISEHLPGLAEQMDKIALVRSVTSKEGNHARAQELAHTGHVPNPTVSAPSIGAWMAKLAAGRTGARALDLPPFVSLGGPSHGAGFLGRTWDPLVVQEPGAAPDNLAPARDVGKSRDGARRALRGALDEGFATRTRDPRARDRIDLYARATALMGSDASKAFDVESEPAAVKKAYGDSDFGRGCLAARRLVEAGVPFIEVTLDGWDTHADGFEREKRLMGALDPAMSALVKDLAERGLLDETLVVWMGEFGRTPAINANDGRDHHPAAFSIAMAGAGVRGGAVHGETDADGAKVVSDPVLFDDVLATVATRMGFDPETRETTPLGRPIGITERGAPIGDIVKKD
ncbi:MAG: DUF1501 domain-containing protein [Polyangiaceae bacterium]